MIRPNGCRDDKGVEELLLRGFSKHQLDGSQRLRVKLLKTLGTPPSDFVTVVAQVRRDESQKLDQFTTHYSRLACDIYVVVTNNIEEGKDESCMALSSKRLG